MIKIKHTEQHQGKIVCKGKLLLIETKEPTKLHLEEDGQMMLYNEPCIYSNTKRFISIIISKNEEIEAKDKYFNSECNTIDKSAVGEVSLGDYDNCSKILALPKNFSPEQLQMIVDGKMKDGDEVFLKCSKANVYIGTHPNSGEKNVEIWDGDYAIKLNNQNHITLIPNLKEAMSKAGIETASRIFKEESWDDILDLMYKSLRWRDGEIEGWESMSLEKKLKENYHPPIRK